MAGIWPRIVAALLGIVAIAWIGTRLTASRQDIARAHASLAASDSAIFAEAPRRLATEPRDPRWSFATEELLNGAFARVPGLVGMPLARCATTVCRIAGPLPAAGPTRDAATVAIRRDAIPLALATRRLRAALTRFPAPDPSPRFEVWLIRGPLPRRSLSS